jgi:ABC-type uncharacterized transport system auxiliary subunit
MMHHLQRSILPICMVALLAGCGPLLPQPKEAPRQYTISGGETGIAPVSVAEFSSLEIQRPTSAPGLDVDRVAHQSSPHRLDYLADARWAANATSMLQYALVETFSRSGQFSAVASDEASMKTDHTLAVDLQSYQLVDVNGAPHVQIRFAGRLMALPSREVVKMQQFEASEPVATQNMENVAAAFQQAYNKLAAQLLESTATSLRSLKAQQLEAEAAKAANEKKTRRKR